MDNNVVHASASEFDTVFKVGPTLFRVLDKDNGLVSHISELNVLHFGEGSVVRLEEGQDGGLASITSLRVRRKVDQLNVLVVRLTTHCT